MIQSLRNAIGKFIMKISPWYDEKEANKRARETERVVKDSNATRRETTLLLASYEDTGRLISKEKLRWN